MSVEDAAVLECSGGGYRQLLGKANRHDLGIGTAHSVKRISLDMSRP